MRVLLVNPGVDPRFAVQEPLHLGFIAAFLEARGVEVAIADELAGEDVAGRMDQWHPALVGITATTPLASSAYRVAALARDRGLPTVMGGVHASVVPEEALKHVDMVVQGEGEQALARIIDEGLTEGIVTAPYIRDLDAIPSPARHLMQMEYYGRTTERNPRSYLHFVPAGARVAAMLTSRGCPFRCTFCHNVWRGMPFRFNSAERVVEELAQVTTDYRLNHIFFIEDNFFASKKRLRAVCDMLIGRGADVVWGCNARVSDVDAELLALVKAAGCAQITFGFESGSQRVLDSLNKQTRAEQNWEAVRLCRAAGIMPQGTVMLGCPGETVADIRLTQAFVRGADLTSVGVCLATPYPGTEMWQQCADQGKIPDDLDWDAFTYDRTPVRVCDTIDVKTLEALYRETCQMVADKDPRNRVSLLTVGLSLIHHPWAAWRRIARLLVNPSRWASVWRRLKP